MTYTNNVPQATQTIAQTQAPILNNFAYIDTALQRDHTFNGNDISGEVPGYHQKISAPNQLADIAVLPANIDAIMYAIGGQFYNYNGAKGPMSAVCEQGPVTINGASLTTVFTAIPNSIGIVIINTAILIGNQNCLSTFIFNTTPLGPPPAMAACYVGPLQASSSNIDSLNAVFNGLDFQVQRQNSGSRTYYYKVIYWPI